MRKHAARRYGKQIEFEGAPVSWGVNSRFGIKNTSKKKVNVNNMPSYQGPIPKMQIKIIIDVNAEGEKYEF